MSMKVGSASTVKQVGSTRKGAKVSATGGDFASFLEETDALSSSAVGAASGVAGLDALLAAQTVGDALQDETRKKRAVTRGNDILDRLEDLRAALLSGGISKSKLIELAQMLREKRDSGLDDALNQILDDIELRAEVELAKLSSNV